VISTIIAAGAWFAPDLDGDGVSNVDEIEAGSNPLDADDTKKPKRFVPIMMDDLMVMVPLD